MERVEKGLQDNIRNLECFSIYPTPDIKVIVFNILIYLVNPIRHDQYWFTETMFS